MPRAWPDHWGSFVARIVVIAAGPTPVRVPISFKVSLPKASMFADFNLAIASLEVIPKAGAADSSVALERARNTAPGFALDTLPVTPVKTTLATRLAAKTARAALRLRYAVNDFQFLARCHIATTENTTLSHSCENLTSPAFQWRRSMTPVTVETTKAMIVTGVTTSRIDILAFMDIEGAFGGRLFKST